MSIGLVIFLALIGIPLIEIAVFIEVGGRIGLLSTLIMIFATAVVGTALLRYQGLSVLADARNSMERNQLDGDLGDEGAQRRDALLLKLLRTPPQPRPKRERGKKKPTRTRASRASAKKP